MQDIHLTNRTRWPHRPFVRREVCAEIWPRLRRRFPKVLAAVLMPNHLHIALRVPDPEAARQMLAAELRAFSRAIFPGTNLWEEVPPPEPSATQLKLQLMIRYVLLNPCRGRLAKDPIEWEWSTHRDTIGAAYPLWVDLPALAQIFDASPKRLPEVFHRFVSGDAVNPATGTPLKLAHTNGEVFPVHSLVRAASIALRSKAPDSSQVRRVATILASKFTRLSGPEIAQELGVSRQRVQQLLTQVPSGAELEAIAAAERVLLDPRLLKGTQSLG